MGHVAPEVRQIVMAQARSSPDTISVWFDVPVLNCAIWSALISVAELSVHALSISNAGNTKARDRGIIAYP